MKIFHLVNKQEIEKCLNEIKHINLDANYACYIEKTNLLKTKEQCAFFHKLLQEFVNTGIECVDNFNREIGYWKYKVKKECNFYNTKKGCLFSKERSIEINTYLKQLPEDVKNDIVKAMTMNVKSISNANLKELNTLINCLCKFVVYFLGQNIYNNNFLLSAIEEKYNNIICERYFQDNQNEVENSEFIALCDEKFKFKPNELTGRYCIEKN